MVSGKSYSTDHTMGFVNVMRSDSIEISKSFDSIASKLLVCFMSRDKPLKKNILARHAPVSANKP